MSVSPRIVPFSFEEPIFAGQAAQVSCLVSEGDAPIQITWNFANAEIPKDFGVDVQKMGKRGSALIFESADARHRGNYTCLAANSAATTQYTTVLNVHGNCKYIYTLPRNMSVNLHIFSIRTSTFFYVCLSIKFFV
uniref:Down syndrome cell adhesion molecule-like protein Dscam2 n=2 Tax=Cacopsylla melanoneura TaxID=428564 RepID=A0A8D9BPB9_9HEMI